MPQGMEHWLRDQAQFGWVMPAAPWWNRLPLIRHFRFLYHAPRALRHADFCLQLGMLPSGYDRWVLYGMWHGLERKPREAT